MSRWRRQLKRRHNEARAIAGTIGWTFEPCIECGAKANSYHFPGCPFAPFVCPGCHAINDEPCAGYCPDAALRREREERAEEDWAHSERINAMGAPYCPEEDAW